MNFIDPFSIFTTVFAFACSHGMLPDCNRYNAHCMAWYNVPACYQQNFGDIHTKEYRQALKDGHNIKVNK